MLFIVLMMMIVVYGDVGFVFTTMVFTTIAALMLRLLISDGDGDDDVVTIIILVLILTILADFV